MSFECYVKYMTTDSCHDDFCFYFAVIRDMLLNKI